MTSLADLPKSPERRVLESVGDLLMSDSLLSACFKPMRILETTSRESFKNFAAGSMAIQPMVTKPEPRPSQREVEFFNVMISAFLAVEQTDSPTKFIGLDLGGYLRKLLWGLAVPNLTNPAVAITFATTEFKALPPLLYVQGGTRILSYQAGFETDIDPTENDFSA